MRPDGLTLELTRVLACPREQVFEFFTDAQLLSQWWGPAGFNIPNIEFAPSVGATYRIEMQPPSGDTFELVGTFKGVEPPALLAFSFEWRPSDPDDIETVAQLSFEQINDSTEVRLTHRPFRNEARRALHRDGWSESFDKLAELMTDER